MNPLFRYMDTRGAFTLVELIGVLAIISILAGIVAPNAIRALDRAAVEAERDSVHNIAAQVKLYLKDQGVPPSEASWTNELAPYVELSPSNLATNRRNNGRVFLHDPAMTTTRRAMILSSMRAGLALPAASAITTTARFGQIWETADGAVPPTSSWSGWSNWTGAGEFLVLERINLMPVYHTDLQDLTVTLNNLGGVAAAYNIVRRSGVMEAAVTVAPGANVVLSGLRPKEQINLYNSSSATTSTLNYSYVLSDSGKTFDFDGTQWLPQ